MYTLVLCTIFSFFTSCDDSVYYKTFDYKTMTFIQPTDKQDNCIRFISQSDTLIELEVICGYHKTVKRTYIKKDKHWYSKVKYELVGEPEVGLDYGGKHEIEYFIFKDHMVFSDDIFTMYLDLKTEKEYICKKIKTKKTEDITLNDVKKYDYDQRDYYVYFDVLHERWRCYEKGLFKEEVIEQKLGEPVLDIFYWIDQDIYMYSSSDMKFIYDDK